MRAQKLMAGVVIAGGLAAAAVGVGAGTAAAAPASGPVPAWGGPAAPGHDWGHRPPNWNPNEGPWGPAGWNGGWQPPGAVCLGQWCI